MNRSLVVGCVIEPLQIYECAFPRFNRTGSKLQYLPGLGMDLLRIIFRDFALTPVEYNAFGNTGRTNGSVVHALVQGAASISLPQFFYGSERAEVVTYMLPTLMETRLGYLVNPLDAQQSSMPIFSPFQGYLWILGSACFLLFSTYLTLVRKIQFNLRNFMNTAYEIPFGQRRMSQWKSSPEIVCITVWSMLARLMTVYYRMHFVKNILPMSPALFATYFNDMYKLTNGYQLVLPMNSALELEYTNHIVLGKQFKRNLDTTPSMLNAAPPMIDLARYALSNPGRIFVNSDEVLSLFRSQIIGSSQHNSFVIKDNLRLPSQYYALAKKNYFNRTELLKITMRMTEVQQYGLVRKLSKVYGSDDEALDTQLSWSIPNKPREPVSLMLVWKFVQVYSCGIFLGIFVFIIERLK